MIVSADIYRQPDVSIPQDIISPSIDPLSPKNMDMADETVAGYLYRHSVPQDKPLISQVSRFDPWKDPEGVLESFELIRREVDCRLVFCYNLANDDPEGAVILERMLYAARDLLSSGDVVFVRGDDPMLVNAIQRASNVVIQKSIREGFGLTVTEAMWKGTPVVASDVGGIPTQIEDGRTGFLVTPGEPTMCAERVVELLTNDELAERIGTAAKEHVRRNFLITRHLLDYLKLFERS
jgi:trehalose synthase